MTCFLTYFTVIALTVEQHAQPRQLQLCTIGPWEPGAANGRQQPR